MPSLPQLVRQGDHELALLEARLLELQRLRAAKDGAAVGIDTREIQVVHRFDLTRQPDSFVIKNPGAPQSRIDLEPDLQGAILCHGREPPGPFQAIHPDDEPRHTLAQPDRLPDLRFRHQRISDKDVLHTTIRHDLSLGHLGHRNPRSPSLQLFSGYARDLVRLHVRPQRNTVPRSNICHLAVYFSPSSGRR